MTLRIIDTFSGIGGFSLAARWLGGFQTVQFVEWDPYCQRILAQHFPGIPIHGDISTYFPTAGAADIVCGGFPCQDISVAGKQEGIKTGTRSGLYYELMRVVRTVRPQYVVLENVAAITSNGLGSVLGELAQAGFDAEWACIPASDLGACHRRDRWWLVAYANSHDSKAGDQQQERAREAVIDCKALAGNASNAKSIRCRTWQGCGSEKTGQQKPGVGDGAARSDVANSNSQRQQEQHHAAIADPSRWPSWRHASRSLNPNWRAYAAEPLISRNDDGLPNRVDRIRALGNAVVPQVAMIPLQRVLDLHRGKC